MKESSSETFQTPPHSLIYLEFKATLSIADKACNELEQSKKRTKKKRTRPNSVVASGSCALSSSTLTSNGGFPDSLCLKSEHTQKQSWEVIQANFFETDLVPSSLPMCQKAAFLTFCLPDKGEQLPETPHTHTHTSEQHKTVEGAIKLCILRQVH